MASADGLSGVGYSYDALGNVVQQSAFGTPTSAIAYQYTGQEFDSETGLHNFRARLYDSDLFRFYATDPAGQDFSPYAFAGNAPVIRVDKDGKLWFVPILIGAAIGGTLNVAGNWNAISQSSNPFLTGLGFFGVGVASGAVSAAAPFAGAAAPALWAASGSISSGGNALLNGQDVLSAIGMGAIQGGVGGALGKLLSPVTNGLLNSINLNGTMLSEIPILRDALSSGIGSGAVGFGLNFGTTLIQTGDFGRALQKGGQGFVDGAKTGIIAGAASSVGYSLVLGTSPFYQPMNQNVGVPQASLDRLGRRLEGLKDRNTGDLSVRAFGSRTKGTSSYFSDLDIAVYGENFKSSRFIPMRTNIQFDFFWETGTRLDLNFLTPRTPVPFSPADTKPFRIRHV